MSKLNLHVDLRVYLGEIRGYQDPPYSCLFVLPVRLAWLPRGSKPLILPERDVILQPPSAGWGESPCGSQRAVRVLKGVIHSKIKIVSCTQPHVISNLYGFFCAKHDE